MASQDSDTHPFGCVPNAQLLKNQSKQPVILDQSIPHPQVDVLESHQLQGTLPWHLLSQKRQGMVGVVMHVTLALSCR
jgi:hypothetical protein